MAELHKLGGRNTSELPHWRSSCLSPTCGSAERQAHEQSSASTWEPLQEPSTPYLHPHAAVVSLQLLRDKKGFHGPSHTAGKANSILAAPPAARETLKHRVPVRNYGASNKPGFLQALLMHQHMR